MDWPNEITLNSRRWNIVYLPETSPDLEDEGDHLLGYCDLASSTIAVCEDQDNASLADSLLHEMFHACYATAPLTGTTASEIDREENVVLFATAAMLQIARNSESDWWRIGTPPGEMKT